MGFRGATKIVCVVKVGFRDLFFFAAPVGLFGSFSECVECAQLAEFLKFLHICRILKQNQICKIRKLWGMFGFSKLQNAADIHLIVWQYIQNTKWGPVGYFCFCMLLWRSWAAAPHIAAGTPFTPLVHAAAFVCMVIKLKDLFLKSLLTWCLKVF